MEPNKSHTRFEDRDPTHNTDTDVHDMCSFDDNIPHTAVFPNAGPPIDDIVCITSFELDNWDPLAPFTTPKQWQLCRSIVDTNVGKIKLNNLCY